MTFKKRMMDDHGNIMGAIKLLCLGLGIQATVFLAQFGQWTPIIVAVLTFSGPLLHLVVKHHLQNRGLRAKELERQARSLERDKLSLQAQVDALSTELVAHRRNSQTQIRESARRRLE